MLRDKGVILAEFFIRAQVQNPPLSGLAENGRCWCIHRYHSWYRFDRSIVCHSRSSPDRYKRESAGGIWWVTSVYFTYGNMDLTIINPNKHTTLRKSKPHYLVTLSPSHAPAYSLPLQRTMSSSSWWIYLSLFSVLPSPYAYFVTVYFPCLFSCSPSMCACLWRCNHLFQLLGIRLMKAILDERTSDTLPIVLLLRTWRNITVSIYSSSSKPVPTTCWGTDIVLTYDSTYGLDSQG